MIFENSTIHQTVKLVVIALLPLALLTACSTSGPTTGGAPVAPGVYADNSGFGGEIVTDSSSTMATVISVDHTRRLVTLKRADGSRVTYKAAPGAFGFDEVKAGDEVKISVAEEMAVFLGRNSLPAGAAADTAKLRVKLPSHTDAFAAEVGILVFTAKVTAINDWNNTVTLQLADGLTKTIKVGETVNLAEVSVEDSVSVRSTEATVILLEKP